MPRCPAIRRSGGASCGSGPRRRSTPTPASRRTATANIRRRGSPRTRPCAARRSPRRHVSSVPVSAISSCPSATTSSPGSAPVRGLGRSRGWSALAIAITALAVACPCFAYGDAPSDPLLGYRSSARTHGLYEIREEAISYLAHEGSRKRAGWRVLDPDIRVQVDKCVVPLRSRWVEKSPELPYPSIEVHCAKTVDARHPVWHVSVPVYRKQ